MTEIAKSAKAVSRHDHIGLFYSSREEQASFIVDYMTAGWEQKEKCVYMADEQGVRFILGALRKNGINVDSVLSGGDLLILKKGDISILDDSSDPDLMINAAKRLADLAAAEGYENLRMASEMTTVFRDYLDPEKMMEYEVKLDLFAVSHNVTVLCQYDLNRFESYRIIQAIQTHPTIVYKNNLCENSFYIPFSEFLRNDNADNVVKKMLGRLLERKLIEHEISSRTNLAKQNNLILRNQVAQNEKTIKFFKESESYFRNMVNSAPVAIVMTDKGGRCLFANEYWQMLSGLSLQESIGSGWQKAICKEDVEKIGPWWYRRGKKGMHPGTECRIISAGGETRWAELKTLPFYDDAGDMIGYIASFADITHRIMNRDDILDNRIAVPDDREENKGNDTYTLYPAVNSMK